jgi:FixJ family two-component response regulator
MPAVMLTAYGDIPTAVQATKQGAADFLLKPVRNEDLLRAVHDALSSARAAPPALLDDPPDSAWHECLTKREREIVDLAIAGKSSKEIGRILGISNRTVDVHRAHVLEKTGAKSIFDIARTIWSER